jgi:hypothetical protein
MRAPQCGAVSFIQRFGSALNLNLHFHTLALDGVYTDDGGLGAAPRFLPLPPPDGDAVARVLAGTARRLQRIVAKRAAEDEDALARDESLLAVLAAASLRAIAAASSACAATSRVHRSQTNASKNIPTAGSPCA